MFVAKTTVSFETASTGALLVVAFAGPLDLSCGLSPGCSCTDRYPTVRYSPCPARARCSYGASVRMYVRLVP